MKYEYDIAISYKSELGERAQKIANYLKADGWNIFFAPYNQQEMLSEDIYSFLYGIFKNKSQFKVLLISENYLEGEWTSLEMRMSLKSTEEERKRLMIINYTDQLQLPEKLKTLQYLNGKDYAEDEIASLITERMQKYAESNEEKRADVRDGVNARAKSSNVNITINKGIIAGNNAHFGNIQL